MTTITLKVEGTLEKTLNRLADQKGTTPEEVVLDLLKRLDNLQSIEYWRSIFVPLAEKAGIYTDEDVDRLVEEVRAEKAAEK